MLVTEPAPIHGIVEHILFYGIQTGLLAGLVKLIWGAAKLDTTVNLIMTNHLPHIDAKVDGVADSVKDLRSAFVQHLDSGRD